MSANSQSTAITAQENLGVVRIRGKDHYLGKFRIGGELWSRYYRLLADHLGAGKSPDSVPQAVPAQKPELTVNQLILRYWRHAEVYYRKKGKPTSEQGGIRAAMVYLRSLYGTPGSCPKSLPKPFGASAK